jgi:hypothetical protein
MEEDQPNKLLKRGAIAYRLVGRARLLGRREGGETEGSGKREGGRDRGRKKKMMYDEEGREVGWCMD